ncbi:hypothetical protein [Aporhodopirellula aestuarii]|uniref:HEAT repeat domain-containing protein n=1 Tax=Aporhodopirellula aestuarii TaxID=2950107 RepID=A0ABT0TZ41_9BACT|nr:hypothetical protein [Aporhodopirellula aestuarii]MCM2369868.1 hypothetical protein [Aporhodopirellula aestuarii]
MSRTRQPVSLFASLALLISAAGCAMVPPAPTETPIVPQTSANLADTTIVAIQPAPGPARPVPNLLDLTGVTHILESVSGCVVGSVQHFQYKLGGRFPGLEGAPPLLAITDPANLSEQSSPAVKVAAKVKAEEDAAQQKIKGIQYLASLGCGGCYPDVEEALLAALDDCTEAVRFEAAKGIRSTVGSACVFCKADACCGSAVRKKLKKVAYDIDKNGCFDEPSERVRRQARLALCGCCGDDSIEELPEEGPEEGPEESTDPAAEVGADPVPGGTVASSLGGDSGSLDVHQIGAVDFATPQRLPDVEESAHPRSGVGSSSQRPTSITKPAVWSKKETPAIAVAWTRPPSQMKVSWEEITIDPQEFDSVERARQIMVFLKSKADGKDLEKPEFTADEISVRRFELTSVDEIRWNEKQSYLKKLPVGKTSPILTRDHRWYLLRVLSRADQ